MAYLSWLVYSIRSWILALLPGECQRSGPDGVNGQDRGGREAAPERRGLRRGVARPGAEPQPAGAPPDRRTRDLQLVGQILLRDALQAATARGADRAGLRGRVRPAVVRDAAEHRVIPDGLVRD